jgi:class 3 adenylate cyclase
VKKVKSAIADLFPHTAIMFADVAGFTAWSSEREPVQVFQLLEALCREFDRTAKRSGVFKVETIGDCCKWHLVKPVLLVFISNCHFLIRRHFHCTLNQQSFCPQMSPSPVFRTLNLIML